MNDYESSSWDNNGNYKSINWNAIEDQVDIMTWQKLVSQFWVDTRIPVSNDLDDWRTMSPLEKDVLNKAFAGLTLLDTLQSQDGIHQLRNYVRTQHEDAVLNNISFMESVHAKSYSTIFTTLNNNDTITDIFKFADTNELLQNKALIIYDAYQTGEKLKARAASVLLESFLFYSGFYAPLYFLGNNKMSSVAEIIKLIIKDESVHGTYIGYKFQLSFNELDDEEKDEIKDWVYTLLFKLYENEVEYTEYLYGEIGWTKEVNIFLRYNANKALSNLGLDPLFPDTADDVNPLIINGLSGSAANHDFFSKVGNSYFVGDVEAMRESDYDFNSIKRQ